MKAALILALIALALALGIIEGGLRLYAELRAPRFVGVATPTDDTQPDPLLARQVRQRCHGAPAMEPRMNHW